MKFNKQELEQKVIYNIQKTIQSNYGIYIPYDLVLKIANVQFIFVKYGIENNISKINIITMGSYKRSFYKKRIKELKESFISTGLSIEEACNLAKSHMESTLKTLSDIELKKVYQKRNISKVISLPIQLCK